jgi:hypothetical protein
MKKIGDYDLFFDFQTFQFSLIASLARYEKKSNNPKNGDNLQLGKFLQYLKKLEPSSYQGSRKKRPLFNKFSLFFSASFMDKKANY